MAEHGAAMRGWLLALLGATVLFLAGLVLSYILWNHIESAATVPCSGSYPEQVQSTQDNLRHAASLLNPHAPELRLSLSHIFQFPFQQARFISPYADAQSLCDQVEVLWDCADEWEQNVTSNDSYISLLAVTATDVIPIRLQRTEFDLAEPCTSTLSPETILILRKRPGSDQVLFRIQPPAVPQPSSEAPSR
ncbi:MAG: hypothetical protein KKE73_16680 [Proteobacteria bacterium]|nr:hypothetical protein [Pseudomonadota bacterium]